MKRIIIALILLTNAHTLLIGSEFPTNGTIIAIREVIAVGVDSRIPLIFQDDRQDYVNGGLTFNYDGIWTTIPRVLVTIELVNPASPTDTYSAVISSNSAASTTVLVYKISNGGAVVEAASGEVKVTMFAIQNFF